jgi:hypothetical protein
MVGKDIYTNCGTVGLMEWPDGEARRRDEGGPRYPMGEQDRRTPGRVPNGGWTGARWRGTGARQRVGVARRRARCVSNGGRGLGGWPNGGLYKYCWPSFLGTLLLRPVAPARNVGAQGANE